MLTISTDNAAVPGSAMVKQLNGITYLFVQSDRRSTTGANFTYAIAGLAGQTAKIVYDSDSDYDRANSTRGNTLTLSGAGQFTDALGTHSDHYQVKAYQIE
jgi:hypothetical protein